MVSQGTGRRSRVSLKPRIAPWVLRGVSAVQWLWPGKHRKCLSSWKS